jgi:hypothetical protein
MQGGFSEFQNLKAQSLKKEGLANSYRMHGRGFSQILSECTVKWGFANSLKEFVLPRKNSFLLEGTYLNVHYFTQNGILGNKTNIGQNLRLRD